MPAVHQCKEKHAVGKLFPEPNDLNLSVANIGQLDDNEVNTDSVKAANISWLVFSDVYLGVERQS